MSSSAVTDDAKLEVVADILSTYGMDGGYPSASRYFGDLFLVADVRYGEPQGIDVYRQADLIVWYDALVAWAEEQDDAVDLHDAVGEIEWPKDVEETAAA